MSSATELLKRISEIKSRYEESIGLTGEAFNVFDILGLTTKEVRLHSRFLGGLLHPGGSHRMKDFFLKEFIAHLQNTGRDISQNLSTFDTTSAFANVEYHLGPANKEMTSGGRVDILIGDGERRYLIIENKLYAGDQYNQLVRYNAVQNKVALIYLTLQGTPPSESSAGGLTENRDYICLSYGKDILQWLNKCLADGTELSGPVKYTVQQYIWLLEKITGNAKNDYMSQEIVTEMTAADEHIESSFFIAAHIEQLKEIRGQAIFRTFENKLSGSSIDCMLNHKYSEVFPWIEIYPAGWKHHYIAFTDENGMFFGIKRKVSDNPVIKFEQISSHLAGFRSHPWWLCSSYMTTPRFNLSTNEPWLQKNESYIADEILNCVRLLTGVSKKEDKLDW